ncbi:MAG: AAA family ATPase [Propionicimonas sp.]
MRTTTPTRPASNPTPTPAPAPPPAPHMTNRALARALFTVWSGDPAVVVDSPPGAGKTHLITHLAHQLRTRAGMTVAVAAQTRAQALDVANRTAATGAPTALCVANPRVRPTGLDQAVIATKSGAMNSAAHVTIATTARWQWSKMPRHDVLLVDEAYQLTFGDLGTLGALADQVVLVGDPGQIAPVVTGSTRRWENWTAGPQVPAPAALVAAHGEDVSVLHLPQTWRLGPDTTALIAPLYPTLQFTSARPPRHVTDATGTPLPEYRAVPVARTTSPSDPVLALTAASAARDLIGTAHVHDPDGTHTLTPDRVAVIAPHVDQAALIAAALADLPGVFVGTINQAQGLERDVVVAVHPLAGHADAESFGADLGRLCVALSRHRAHLSVVVDDHLPTVLDRASRDDASGAVAAQGLVLARLLLAA